MTKEEFNLLLSEGEGYRFEFNENLSRLDREFVAFANASGGRVILGIKDSGAVDGVSMSLTSLWISAGKQL